MKIIYCGSSVPQHFGTYPDQIRQLIGSEAVKQRENHIFLSLKNMHRGPVDLVFLSTAYGRKRGPFKNQIVVGDDCKVVCLGYAGSKYLRHLTSYVFAFFWILTNYKRGDIAVIYNFPPVYAVPILLLTLLSSRKFVIQFEDFFNPSDIRFYLYGLFERLGMYAATAFLASSSGMKEFLQAKRKDAEICISGGYWPAENCTIEPRSSNKGPLKLLYSGTLDKERGLENLIHYFSVSNDQKFHLLISGSGPLSSAVETAAECDNRIAFLGSLSISEYIGVLREADICISSQYSGISVNFPSKITAYLAFGKIVLSTRLESLVKSEYSDHLIFYDDLNAEDFWSRLNYIHTNIGTLKSQAEDRRSAVRRILKDQEGQLENLLKKMIDA